MKVLPIALLAVSTVVLGSGCVTTSTTVDSQQAQRARELIAEHCDLGRVRKGNPAFFHYVRVAKGATQFRSLTVTHSHPIDGDEATIYSTKTLSGGWVEADISTGKARDNFYYNTTSGDVICSYEDWRGPLRINVPGGGSINGFGQ